MTVFKDGDRVTVDGDNREFIIVIPSKPKPRKWSERRRAERVPNRLYGASINQQGEAI